MSKKWEREDKIIDRLQLENKALKKQVKNLQKSIRRLNKGFHRLEEKEVIETKDIPSEAKKCWDCSGNYEICVIMNRRFRKCSDCGKRGKVKVI